MSSHGIRVAFVGDAGVGKSSIINRIVTGQFGELAAGPMPPVRAPADMAPENVPVMLLDTNSNPSERAACLEVAASADVVVAVYEDGSSESFEGLAGWVEAIVRVTDKPIVVVGNKADDTALRGADSMDAASAELSERVLPLLDEHDTVEACIQCSALHDYNVGELFFLVVKLVLFPVRPLYNVREKSVTSRFLLALERIFRLFDRDHDHVLSEQELLNFQSVCFQVVLTPSDLRGLREVLEEQDPAAVHQGTNGITMPGFVILNKMFIERNKAESNWRVLEMFGYDRDLRLRIDEHGWKLPARRGRQVFELNSRGQQFLRNVFTQFSNNNMSLGSEEVRRIFGICRLYRPPKRRSLGASVADEDGGKAAAGTGQDAASRRLLHPFGPLFPETTVTNARGEVPMQGWLAQWHMLAALDINTCLRYLHVLGFGGGEDAPPTDAVRVRDRESGEELQSLQVVRAVVVGSQGCGKTSLLTAFVNRRFQGEYSPTVAPRHAVAPVDGGDGGATNKYLVLSEFPQSMEAEALEAAAAVDVVALCFDGTSERSLEYAAGLLSRLPRMTPVVLVATKAELVAEAARLGLPSAAQYMAIGQNASRLCDHYSLTPPLPASAAAEKPEKLYQLLVNVAGMPEVARPITEADKDASARQAQMDWVVTTALAGAATVLVLTGAWFAVRWWRRSQ